MAVLHSKINLLVMPTDSCNMECVYCFHSAHHENSGRMTLETLERLYDITSADYSDVSILWHGGEPMLMGLDFFRQAVAMQAGYPWKVKNILQSNLTQTTEEFAEFLCSHKFGVGTSFDGCKNEETRGHSQEILEGREKILRHGKKAGMIMVVSSLNCDNLIESYEYFKAMQANYTLNLYVPTGTPKDAQLKLEPQRAIEKITDFFDYWLEDTDCNIRVNYFERMVRFIATGEKHVCAHHSCLGKWLGIRWNGDIVPCNRYFPEEYCFGNIRDYRRLSDAFESSGFQKLLSGAVSRRYQCKSCEAFLFCSGGCNHVALNENGIENNGGESCIMLRNIYRHIVARTLEAWQKGGREMEGYNPRFRRIIGRNKSLFLESAAAQQDG